MWTPSKSDDLNPGATSTKRSQHESGLLWVRNCLSGPKPGICREIIQECYEIIQNQMGSNSILKKRVCLKTWGESQNPVIDHNVPYENHHFFQVFHPNRTPQPRHGPGQPRVSTTVPSSEGGAMSSTETISSGSSFMWLMNFMTC